MWKLILFDTFHLKTTPSQSILTTIIMSINFVNWMLQIKDSKFMPILVVGIVILMTFLIMSPIRITKGLYLCPLTENDRKRYLKSAFLFRFVCHELVFAITIISAGFINNIDHRVLLLIYVSFSMIFLGILLLVGFYNPEMEKRQYYIMNKLPVPTTKQHPSREKNQTSQNGVYLLVTTLFLSVIGILIPGFNDSYNNQWLFFYIPAHTLCILFIILYFIKYFDVFITINANYEIYSFTPKKKAGVY